MGIEEGQGEGVARGEERAGSLPMGGGRGLVQGATVWSECMVPSAVTSTEMDWEGLRERYGWEKGMREMGGGSGVCMLIMVEITDHIPP